VTVGLGLGNANLDLQPLSVVAQGWILTPDNTVLSGVSVGANFSFGDSGEHIRESITDYMRQAFGDPHLDVNFITG
jgi:hypothetical protein